MALKLVMEQGPREGERIEYPVGSTIRIGRIVRGNKLAIKDVGISTKHLSISSESGKWVLRDLGSSNGTILNGETIPPETPFDLHDGDCIKIGECTKISVLIIESPDGGADDGGGGGCDYPSRLRRNPKRGGAGAKEPVPPPAPSAVKVEIKSDEEEEEKGGFVEMKPVRTTRRGRPAQSSKNKKEDAALPGSSVLGQIPEDRGEVEEGKIVQVRRTRAGLRSRKNLAHEKPSEEMNLRESGSTGVAEAAAVSAVGLNSAQEHPSEKKNLGDGDSLDVAEAADESVMGLNSEGGRNEVKDDNGKSHYGVEESSGKAKDGNNLGSKNESWDVELEKMTLGEWFDYMEVNLPRQIIEATEEIIKGMKEKAERVNQYVAQHKNQNGKVPVHKLF